MPYDLLIGKQIDPAGVTGALKEAIGDSKYVFTTFNNDINFNLTKELVLVNGVNVLVQGILKDLLTPIGEAFEDPEYGVSDFGIGEKMTEEVFAQIRTGVSNTLYNYSALMSQQSDNPDELIGTIDDIRVNKDDVDPRRIFIYITLTTQGGTTVTVAVTRIL